MYDLDSNLFNMSANFSYEEALKSASADALRRGITLKQNTKRPGFSCRENPCRFSKRRFCLW